MNLTQETTERSRCLQESGNGTDNGEHSSASLGSSAGELGNNGLGAAGGSSASGVSWDSCVLGWVRNNRGGAADSWDNGNGSAGLSWNGSGLDWDSGGVFAVIVNEGGALGHGVGLGANRDGGWAIADRGETLDGGGGVAGGSRHGISRSGGDWVGSIGWLGGDGVGRSLGGLVAGGSYRGGVLSGISIRIGVGSGGKASDDGEGTHLDCWVWGGIKYVGIKY
jgi:hypothetical protein